MIDLSIHSPVFFSRQSAATPLIFVLTFKHVLQEICPTWPSLH